MARTKRVCCFAALIAVGASAQRTTNTSPTSNAAASSPTDSAPTTSITPSPTTQDSTMGVPMSLWNVATSLLTKYYPSTTITDFRSLSWPRTLVIGDSTYTVHTGQTTTSAEPTTKTKVDATHTTQASQTPPASDDDSKSGDWRDGMTDKKLSIIIGVVVGFVVFALLSILFFCLRQRRKDTGSFFLRRSTSSPMPWRPPQDEFPGFGNVSYVTLGDSHEQLPKPPQVSVTQARRHTPPLHMHPALLHAQTSRSTTSFENPFLTPQERSYAHLNELDGQALPTAELDHHEPSHRRSSSSIRPPTPFSPQMMLQQPRPGPSQQRPQIHINPFASAEDREADAFVSPIVAPAKSPERRYSPMVHYPSWDEVSEFNFTGDERGRGGPPSEDGGDGYRPVARERRDGRYELA